MDKLFQKIVAQVVEKVENSAANRSDPSEVARQVADRECAFQRSGWRSEDYQLLRRMIFQAAMHKLGGYD